MGSVLTQIILNFSPLGICLFSLFMWSFIYISMDLQIFFFYFRLQSHTTLFHCSNRFSFSCWKLSAESYVSFTFHHIYNTFLVFGSIRCFRLIFYSFCSSSRIIHFPNELWFPLLENVLIFETKSGCKVYLLLKGIIASRYSQMTEQRKYMCAYQSVYIYKSLNISICSYLYLY